MVVGLTMVAIVALLLIQFRGIIGPLILSFVLAYLLHPIAQAMNRRTGLPWRGSVNLLFLGVVIVVAGLLTATGFAIVNQIQNLVGLIQTFVTNLPTIIADISTQEYWIGPFPIDLSQLNLENIADQLLPTVQGMLGRVTGFVGTIATSAASTLGWILFVLVIAYFLLADTRRVSDELIRVDIPGYTTDIRRLGKELGFIWNAFLRGQLIIVSLVIIFYTILMMALGIRYAVGIAILAGLGRFVPYLGPTIVWIVIAVVAIFQGENYFNLPPVTYAVIVIAAGVVLDQVFDNLVSPRLLGTTLGVHPAGVLIAAIVATRWMGIIGLVLAAPVLATLQLVGTYIFSKMFDLNPWPAIERRRAQQELPLSRSIRRFRAWLRTQQRKT
jgi:predicted PurR-regulated permease PerM